MCTYLSKSLSSQETKRRQQDYSEGTDVILMLHSKATRGPLVKDLVTLSIGQVTKTTPELEPHLLTTTPHQRLDKKPR
ncbi:hypothetical protein TNCV_2419161 [Trichonephila clavipes]|nr:hypothetical protein TNCV_2419161 [Trichonephila clavipes]